MKLNGQLASEMDILLGDIPSCFTTTGDSCMYRPYGHVWPEIQRLYTLKYIDISLHIYIYIITYICIKTDICWWNMVEPPFEGSKRDSYHPVVSWSRYIILYPFINDLLLGYWPVIKSFPQHIVLDNYIHHMIISLGQAPKWMLLFFPQQHQGYLQHDDS